MEISKIVKTDKAYLIELKMTVPNPLGYEIERIGPRWIAAGKRLLRDLDLEDKPLQYMKLDEVCLNVSGRTIQTFYLYFTKLEN